MAEAHYHYLVVGGLREDYCITHDGRVTEGAQGGNAAYAGAGAALWNRSVGLLSRVGCNYPSQWLGQLQRGGGAGGGGGGPPRAPARMGGATGGPPRSARLPPPQPYSNPPAPGRCARGDACPLQPLHGAEL